jgi:hypothetical protein
MKKNVRNSGISYAHTVKIQTTTVNAVARGESKMKKISFLAMVAKSGRKYYIEVPKALHLEVKELLGKKLKVSLEEMQ